MRMGAIVDEFDFQAFPFGRPKGRTGDTAVIGPGRKHDAWRDLDFLFLYGNFEAAQLAPVPQVAQFARIPIGEHARRIEAVAGVVDRSDSDH